MSETPIRSATAEERDQAVNTIMLGFAADPVCRWMWPDAASYAAAMPRLIDAFAGHAFEKETAFVTPGIEAAALWLPPGTQPDSDAMTALVLETAKPDHLPDIAAFFERVDEYHPEEEIWYLPLIGADPLHIGRGYGGALMKHAMQLCDEEGKIAYLESSNPRNISLYLRHGFEPIGEIQVGSSPVMTPMVRAAR